MRSTFSTFCLTSAVFLSACASSQAPDPKVDPGTSSKLTDAVNGTHRSDAEKARDVYRHPAETLEFFGLRDDMTVVELFPGAGWFTAILAPVLAESGVLVEQVFGDMNGPDNDANYYAVRLNQRISAAPGVYAKLRLIAQPTDSFDLGPNSSADMVVTFRNLHNLKPDAIKTLLAAVHAVLKPGGIFGIEEHRAAPGADPAKGEATGYLPEQWVIDTIEAAGFKLAGKSEINANPKDTKDYPEGVWTLPPTFALKDQDREKYAAIGESDRMTLKFVKK